MLKLNQIIIGDSILAILLLLCLFDMPYGFYELIRIIAAIYFAVLGYSYYTQDKIHYSIISFGLSILFQPFIKIALGRTLWNVVDVIVAAWLIIQVFILSKKSVNKV